MHHEMRDLGISLLPSDVDPGNRPHDALVLLTDRLADGLRNSGVLVSDPKLRAPHILSLRFPGGMPDNLIARLEAENVFVSPRLGLIRISPHVYNDEADVDRFVEVLRRVSM
jgi:selenocysteine lyase/cysteine desulfurase